MILFDEINLAPSDVLTTLLALFNTDEKILCFKDYNINKNDSIFICSMNPVCDSGRSELPNCLKDLINTV